MTDMDYLFYDETTCNPDIGAWNVSSVTTMSYTFMYASAFDQGTVYVVELRLRKWVGRGVQSPVDLFRSFHGALGIAGDPSVKLIHQLTHLFTSPMYRRHRCMGREQRDEHVPNVPLCVCV